MKFDLHCHTKGGSIDSKVTLESYVKLLKEQGFGGMMITDHTSQRGHKKWDKIRNQEEFKDFVVLKGVEYDTIDAGHFLVIMPENVNLKILSVRGLPLGLLIEIVHYYGGLIGPAHPFGVRSSSSMFLKALRRNPKLIKKFDYVEAFNTCESKESNIQAAHLANTHGLPGLGGSDSHKEEYVGMAYTDIDADIKNNNDFIKAVKAGCVVDAGGSVRQATTAMYMKENWTAVWAFKAYNYGLGRLFTPVRNFLIREFAHN